MPFVDRLFNTHHHDAHSITVIEAEKREVDYHRTHDMIITSH